MYDRDDAMHEDEARAKREFDEKVAKTKAMFMNQFKDMSKLNDKGAAELRKNAEANFKNDALADFVKDVVQEKAIEKI